MQRLAVFSLLTVALTAACAHQSSMASMGFNPYGSSHQHPHSSMGYNPFGSSHQHPHSSMGYNPFGSSHQHPHSSMGYNPFGSSHQHPHSSMGYNPFGSSHQHPHSSMGYNPFGSSHHIPYSYNYPTHYSSPVPHYYSMSHHHPYSMGYPPPNYPPHPATQNDQYRRTCWDMGYDASNVETHIDCLEYLMSQQHMFTQYELEMIEGILVQLAEAMNIDVEVSPADQIRLVGGYDSMSGRVEILHAGLWGTVCDDEWDDCDARVVCRMLGYNNGQAFQNACFGEGWGDQYTILLDDVHCSGDEDDLLSCPRGQALGRHNCAHHEDAGVRCWNDTADMLYPCNNLYHYDYSIESMYCTWGSMGPYKRDLEDLQGGRPRWPPAMKNAEK